jgi:hypothetical protein
MSWQNMSDKDKHKYLIKQMADIETGRALLDRFEKVTQRWLKKLDEEAKQQAFGKATKRK